MRLWLCLTVLIALGCEGPRAGSGAEAGSWQLVFENLPSALISVWGASSRDVWTVGADAGSGPLVLHFDGEGWTRKHTGVRANLWWVTGFATGVRFLGGSHGTVLRYADAEFTALATPSETATVFGLWGPSEDKLWIVGHDTEGAFIWRFDGEHITSEERAPAALLADKWLFKVWGRSERDVTFVGSDGLMMHFDGTAFTQLPADDDTRSLFTVHGRGESAFAVGGFGSGVILEQHGAGWSVVGPKHLPELRGVFVAESAAYAVGVNGEILQRKQGTWQLLDTGLDLARDFHSVWVDEKGAVWAVGGRIVADPLIQGMLVYRGRASLPSELEL